MALTGKLLADFSEFNTAVQQAEAKLRSFETGAGKVQNALQRMTDSFDGRKVIQDATLMEQTFRNLAEKGIGLTRQEMARMGTVAQEAAEKLRAMGQAVPVGIQKIADASKNAAKDTSTFAASLQSVNSVLGAFGVSLSIGAVVQFGRSILNLADNLVRVADRTGLTTTEVQKLQYIAEQSGNSLDDFTGAVSKLQANLVGGDKGAAAAVKALGLNFQELRQATPFSQMEQIATAIAKIPDPAARAALAIELFGRQGAAILPTLIADFQKLGDEAPVMADKTVRALDKAGDSLQRYFSQLKVWAAESYNFVGREFDKMTAVLDDANAKLLRGTAKLLEWLPKNLGGFGDLSGTIADLRKNADWYNDSANATRAALSRVDVEVRKVVPAFLAFDGALEKTRKSQDAAKEALERTKRAAAEMVQHYRTLADSVDRGGSALAHLGTVIKGEFDNAIQRAMDRADFMTAHFRALWDSVDHGGSSLAHLGQSFGKLDIDIRASLSWVDSLAGIERILQGIQTDFAQMAVVAVRAIKEIDTIWKNSELSKGQKFSQIAVAGLSAGASLAGDTRTGSTLSGAASGAALGSLFGPIGTGIGAGVGALVGFFKGKSEIRKVNEMRQGLIDMMGGWEGINKAAHAAGITLDRVLNARTVKDYEAAVHDLNDAIAFQDEAMQTLRETAEKYGFTLQELGPKFAAAELDEKAQELFKDFKVLTAAGIDVDVVLGKMGDSINEFVHDSIRMGVAVPNAMRPMIERMIELGMLTDENGTVIEDLEDSGISFALTMSEGFEKLIDVVERLADAIARGLGIALDDIATQITNLPDVQIGGVEGGASRGELQGFAGGTHGRYLNFGAGKPVMLHGWEKVTPRGEDQGGLLAQELIGLRSDMARRDAEMPTLVARHVRDAVQTARIRRG